MNGWESTALSHSKGFPGPVTGLSGFVVSPEWVHLIEGFSPWRDLPIPNESDLSSLRLGELVTAPSAELILLMATHLVDG